MKTKSNSIYVSQEYRTNPLSHKPGGYRIAVIMKSGFKKIYDNIKFPDSYAAAIHGDDISKILILN